MSKKGRPFIPIRIPLLPPPLLSLQYCWGSNSGDSNSVNVAINGDSDYLGSNALKKNGAFKNAHLVQKFK